MYFLNDGGLGQSPVLVGVITTDHSLELRLTEAGCEDLGHWAPHDWQRLCVGGVGGWGVQLVGRGRTWLFVLVLFWIDRLPNAFCTPVGFQKN